MMEQKNIAELLKNCPKGMELDCVIFNDVTLYRIDTSSENEYPIRIETKNGNFLDLTKYGTYSNVKDAKCVIFPKGKTTWEGFVPPCEFKDGDIISNGFGCICIYKSEGWLKDTIDYYCGILSFGDFKIKSEQRAGSYFDCIKCYHLASEAEKAKLFQAIKDNGYHWNPESKTLEKLMESKEETNEDVVMSGIYFDRENYADEVELHLGNYEIEVRNGKTYAVFKNQETKISKPIFKVGDKIKHKDTVLTIITVQTNSYIVEDEPYNFGILMFSQQDKWELINEPKFKVGDVIVNNYRKHLNGDSRSWKIYQITNDKYIFTDGSFIYIQDQNNWVLSTDKFDITTLKPFKSKVLVRNYDSDYWKPATFGFAGKDKNTPFCVEGGNFFNKCIPYEGNEHLLHSRNDCDDYYKL